MISYLLFGPLKKCKRFAKQEGLKPADYKIVKTRRELEMAREHKNVDLVPVDMSNSIAILYQDAKVIFQKKQ